jgi:AcrR family transcriptional regulator
MPARISPIYRRLPPGPHRLSRSEVTRHQRTRIHGAMIEAVAEQGYAATSVGRVVALAGVSRRCFYEQFANKEQCFLATFDLLAARGLRRMSAAYLATPGDPEDRLGAAFAAFAEVAATRRKAASLVLLDAEKAGPGGTLRLRRLMALGERLLARSFMDSPGTSAEPAPPPLVRAVAGGLRAAMSRSVRESGAPAGADFAASMGRWTLHFRSPAAGRMAERMPERVARRLRESATGARGEAYVRVRSGDSRVRLLENTLRLAALDDYAQLTAVQIAEAANVSIDAFHALFADTEECFLAALDMLGEELLGIAAADPGLRSCDWPRAVRRAIGELMCFLAEHPVYARTIAQDAFAAGPQAARRNLELSKAIATLLTEGAPRHARDEMLVDGLGGAIWHTVGCQVAAARIQLLPAMSDYISYVALAPAIGADLAAEVVSEDRPV